MNLYMQNPHLAEENSEKFNPINLVDVEISRPLPALGSAASLEDEYSKSCMVFVRLHGIPLGVIEMELPPQGLSARAFADRVWHGLAGEINQHLIQDGVEVVGGLDEKGIPSVEIPECLRLRQAYLETAPFVNVIIATRDRTDRLQDALDSVLASNYPNFEIIVVDNAPSTDATARLIKETYAHTGRVRYVREEWPGLSVAHNRGILEASASYIAITDDDVLVDPNWLAELMRGFSAYDDVGCVTGLIFPQELQNRSQLWFEQYGGFNKGFKQRVFDLQEHRPDDPLYPYSAGKFGTGANMAFRTSVLLEMGGFDPATGIGTPTFGGDDLSAFFEVLQRGYRLVYQPNAIVHHRHRSDYAGLRRQIYGYGVGLTAFLMKTLVDRPSRFFDLLTRIPYGLFFTLSGRSPKNRKKRLDYPGELTRLERKGMIYGPLAYLRSRWKVRRLRKDMEINRLSKGKLVALRATTDQGELRS